MVAYLSKKPKLSFVDDPGKLYRQRRRATQAKWLETLNSKAEVEGPSESLGESPPPSPKEDQPQPPPMGEQPQPERKIKLCTVDTVDLPIINLQDAGRPFKIKVSTICMVQRSPSTDWEALMRNFMEEFYSPTKTQSLCNKIYTFVQFPMETIAEALERFNENMRAELLEWHIDFLKEDGEDGDREMEPQDLKVTKARFTCEECEEFDHVQGKPRFNASSSIQDFVPLCTQFKDYIDEQAKINKDTITKFEAM
jgi:Uri superfamily endonuclease